MNMSSNLCNRPENKALFLTCIKTVLYHDFDIENKLSFNTDFLPSFLMIIDELQIFGRLYQKKEKNYTVLNPKFIEISLKNSKLVLSIDDLCVKKQSPEAQRSYIFHSNKSITNILLKKIEKKDLQKIFYFKTT